MENNTRQRIAVEGSALKLKKVQLRKLELQQLEEEHCKQVDAAAMEKNELMTKSSPDGSNTGGMSELFTEKTR